MEWPHFNKLASIILVHLNLAIFLVILYWVQLVLHPHGIAPTFLKLDSWSPGAGFIAIIYTKGKNQIKKGKCRGKKCFAYKKKYYILKNMGSIPCGSTFKLFIFPIFWKNKRPKQKWSKVIEGATDIYCYLKSGKIITLNKMVFKKAHCCSTAS